MTLIPCPECGQRVSSAAADCPACGFKLGAENIRAGLEREAQKAALSRKVNKGCGLGCAGFILLFAVLFLVDYKEQRKLISSPEVRAVARHLPGNKLGVEARHLFLQPNPMGEGTFVFWPRSKQFDPLHNPHNVLWLVLRGEAYALTGRTKGGVTPSLPFPRDVPAEEWAPSGLDQHSPAQAIELVYGRKQ